MVMRVGEVGSPRRSATRRSCSRWSSGSSFFGEWPNALALVGAGIVVATGVYTILRERAVRRG
jgi:S-adenosylmethionine uptake transporter